MSLVETARDPRVVLSARGQVRPTPRVHYLVHEFDLPPGATRLTVRLRYGATPSMN